MHLDISAGEAVAEWLTCPRHIREIQEACGFKFWPPHSWDFLVTAEWPKTNHMLP